MATWGSVVTRLFSKDDTHKSKKCHMPACRLHVQATTYRYNMAQEKQVPFCAPLLLWVPGKSSGYEPKGLNRRCHGYEAPKTWGDR